VFDIDTNEQIGSVENENVTVLEDMGNRYNIVYDTDKGANTKSGVIWKWDTLQAQETQEIKQNNSSLVSDALINFVKDYERFVDHAYDDGTGVMTIGYGTTRKDLVALGTCTEEQATQWLKEEINDKASSIKADLDSKGVVLTQNQFDALASFAYNCGVDGLLKESNLYNRICQGVRDESLRVNFTAWSKAGGSVMQGLLNRRNEECDMFLHADYIRNL
jgi:GH24 family phage-related lysozyme (muramidase)